jgi:hypothetical protein
MDEPPEKKTGQFVVGNKASPGRKGARNRLHADFVVALQAHFQERGAAAIEIVYRESPRDYLKVIASVLPRELIVEDGRLESMSDEELENHLEQIRELRAVGSNRILTIEGKAKAIN